MNILSFDGIELEKQPNQIITDPNSLFNQAPQKTLNKVYNQLARTSIIDDMQFVDLKRCTSLEEALGKCGLLWNPIKVPIFLEDGTEIPGFYAVVADNNLQESKGIVKGQYEGVSCLDAFSGVEQLLGSGDWRIECGGYPKGAKNQENHSKAVIICRGDDVIIGGDIYQVFVIIKNSFDGSSGVTFQIVFQRLVCLNGMKRYLGGKKNQFQITVQHTKSVNDKIKIANQITVNTATNVKGMRNDFEILSALKISQEEIRNKLFPLFLKAMKLVNNKERERGEEKIQKVLRQLWMAYHADDVQNFSGTAWQVQLMISDYLSHGDPLRDTKNPSYHFNNVTDNDVLTPMFRDYIKDQHGIVLNY